MTSQGMTGARRREHLSDHEVRDRPRRGVEDRIAHVPAPEQHEADRGDEPQLKPASRHHLRQRLTRDGERLPHAGPPSEDAGDARHRPLPSPSSGGASTTALRPPRAAARRRRARTGTCGGARRARPPRSRARARGSTPAAPESRSSRVSQLCRRPVAGHRQQRVDPERVRQRRQQRALDAVPVVGGDDVADEDAGGAEVDRNHLPGQRARS